MTGSRTRLLVSEIHPGNVLLFWLLSFFVKVEAYSILPRCPGFLSGKISVLDLGGYLSWNDTHCFRSRVTQLWEGLLDRFPSEHWGYRHRGLSLDFTVKAKQELVLHFERLILLQEIARRAGPGSKAHIVDSPQFRYLKRLDSSAEFSKYPSVPIISQANVLLDALFMYLYSVAYMSRLLLAMVFGCLSRDRRPLEGKTTVQYIWDLIDANELTIDSNRRYFPWTVDGERVTPEDVLFILPKAADEKSRPDLHSSNYRAFTIPELHRFIPVRILRACAVELTAFLVRYAVPIPRGLPSIRKGYYFASIMRLKPAIQHFSPRCYVTSMSALGSEEASTLYLNCLGVQTVMYCYSANAYLFGNGPCQCDFRAVYFGHILASRLVVWHKDFQEYMQGHPQENTTVEVIGPLMSGDESVCWESKNVLRSRFDIGPADSNDGLKYVSVFDMSPLSKDYAYPNSHYPDSFTEEYSVAFLRDMIRLLEDFKDVALIFKPQRSLVGLKFSYPIEFRDLLDSLKLSGRGFVVEDDINPWLPIALADLCVAMPFTSPPLAAMHHGIPGLFHDPAGIAVHHRYRSMDRYVTLEYDQLREKVGSLLFDDSDESGDNEVMWSEVQAFIGEYPGTDSSDRFRRFLGSAANQEE